MRKNIQDLQNQYPEFNEFYYNFLLKDLLKIEKNRLNYLKIFVLLITFFILLFSCIYFYLNRYGFLTNSEIVMLILLFFLCIFTISHLYKKFNYSANILLSEKFSYFIKNIQRTKDISFKNEIINCGLFNRSRFHVLESYNWQQNDVKVNITTATLSSYSSIPLNPNFKGIILSLEFNKFLFPKIAYARKNRYFYSNFYIISNLLLMAILVFIKTSIITFIFLTQMLCLVLFYFHINGKKHIKNDIPVFKGFDLLKFAEIDNFNTELFIIIEKINNLDKYFTGKIDVVYFDNNKISIFIKSNNCYLFEKQSLFRKSIPYKSAFKVFLKIHKIFKIIEFIQNTYKENQKSDS